MEMDSAERYVIVRVDRADWETFVSPEMLRNYYDLDEANKLCAQLNAKMGTLCDFFVIPYIPALTLITAELNLKAKYAEDPSYKAVTN